MTTEEKIIKAWQKEDNGITDIGYKEARKVLCMIQNAGTESTKTILRSVFKNLWYGIEPEEALKIGRK